MPNMEGSGYSFSRSGVSNGSRGGTPPGARKKNVLTRSAGCLATWSNVRPPRHKMRMLLSLISSTSWPGMPLIMEPKRGSASYTVTFSSSPRRSRTTFPSFRSIEGQSFSPERRTGELSHGELSHEELELLGSFCLDRSGAELWTLESGPESAREFLASKLWANAIFLPLRHRSVCYGALLLFELADVDHARTLLETVDGLGGVITLILRNSVRYEGLAALVERKAREIADQERLFRSLTEISPVGIFRADAQGALQYVNERWCAISGVPKSEVLGRPWSDFVDADGSAGMKDAFANSKTLGIPLAAEFRFGASGAWVIAEIAEERDAEGRDIGYIGSITDISRRKRAEEELLESQRFAQATIDALSQNICVLDDAGRIIAVNRRWRDFAAANGFMSEDYGLGQNYLEVCDAAVGPGREDAATVAAGIRSVAKCEARSFSFAYGCDAPGEERWFRFRVTRFEGEGPLRLAVSHQDISEQIFANEALEESRHRYKELFDNMSAGFAYHRMIRDGEGKPLDYRFLAMNPAFEELTGFSASESVGRTVREVLPGLDPQWMDIFAEVARTGMPQSFQKYTRHVGRHFDVRAFSPEKDCFATIIVDITERLAAERRDKERTNQLIQSEKLASLGVLIAGVAHEINNPNHSLMLNSRLVSDVWASLQGILDKDFGDSSDVLVGGLEYRELRTLMPGIIKGMEQASADIARIVRGLKGFAAMDDSPPEDLDLNLVAKAAVALLSNFIKRSTDRFSLELAESLPPVRGNFQRLEQVLVNLIQNACQALAAKDRAIIVSTVADEAAGWASLIIVDEGEGMDASALARVKEPFFTTKRGKGGLGLGVAITNTIVEEHQGRLSYDSELGRGTRVVVRLPASKIDSKRKSIDR